jgi:Uma2 family endonuclease
MSTVLLPRESAIPGRTIFNVDAEFRLSAESDGTRMSLDEFRGVEQFDSGYHYELIHGVCLVSPAPGPGERHPNGILEHWLWQYQESHPQGKSLDLTLFEQEITTSHGIRRPDRVIWGGLERQPVIDQDPPTIIVEFVSKSKRDRQRDYEQKREEYADIGAKEYWIIDRFRRVMFVSLSVTEGREVGEGETYTTPLLPGFEVPFGKLLAIADRYADQ